MTDGELLAEYGRAGTEATFAELVSRHRPWVYSTARRIVRDPHTADDMTQAVFVLLAGKARSLADHPRLAGWMLRATRHTAERALRATARRSRREAWAAALRWQWASRSSPTAGWDRLAGVLDEQVAALRRADREAILLRYYQSKEMADVAAALGVSEAAARKRVTRAVATLRERLRDRTGLDAPAVPLTAWLAKVTRPTGTPVQTPRPAVPRPAARLPVRWLAITTAAAAAVAVFVVAAQPPARIPLPPAATAPAIAASQPAPAPPAQAATPVDLTGVVRDPDGHPVAGATVTAAPWFRDDYETPPPLDQRPTARTDAAGVYHLRPAAIPVVGTLIARADGFGMSATDVMNLGGPQRADVRLAEPTDLTLTLTRPDGGPAVGVPVRLMTVDRPNPDGQTHDLAPTDFAGPPFQMTTDAQGRCTFTGLPRRGLALVQVIDDRYAQLSTWNVSGDGDVHLGHGATAAVTIPLHPAASISGRVTFGPTGRPVADVAVTATLSHGGPGQTSPVYTAADGTYSIKQLRGGTFAVQVLTGVGEWKRQQMSKRWTAEILPFVTVDPGQRVTDCDLQLIPGVVVHGRVLDDDGKPVAGVRVGPASAPLPFDDTGATGWTAAMTTTDAAGAFSLRLPPGVAQIMVFYPLPTDIETTDESSRTLTVGDSDAPPVDLRAMRVHRP